jgi:uncharacterized damage-inducible protein DinB
MATRGAFWQEGKGGGLIDRERWFNRKFTFDLPVWMAPNVLERLRGTPARVEEIVRGAVSNLLTTRTNGVWSAQENIGHLLDLEPLWLTRVEDILAGRPDLTAADLENRSTNDAGHNTRPLGELLSGFRSSRARLVSRLEQVGDDDWTSAALHPRLRTPMRLIDTVFFVAEHDDHHLATIRALIHAQSGR